MKKFIQYIDSKFLFNLLYRIYKKIQYISHLVSFTGRKKHSIFLSYKKDSGNIFSNLCDRYGSDKGSLEASGHVYPWEAHTYADLYSFLFDHCRQHVTKVFECGIGTNQPDLASSMGGKGKPGASLRVWRDYFPKAIVIGADIDRSILFSEDRINTCYLDQTDTPSILDMWSKLQISDFDLMVDDGLHTYESSINLFENSISQLSRNGIYIIEDVSLTDLARYKEYFDSRDYFTSYVSLFRPNAGLDNNNVVLIRQTYKLV